MVATEIKALAQQTAAATEDIKARIAGVQTATAGGIQEIGKVAGVIQEVNDIVSSIAAAIEGQSAATKDIARDIAEASTGVNDAIHESRKPRRFHVRSPKISAASTGRPAIWRAPAIMFGRALRNDRGGRAEGTVSRFHA